MWLLYGLLTLILWGIWGFILKIATQYVEWYQYYTYGTIIPIILSIALIYIYRGSLAIGSREFTVVILASLAGSLGYITFVIALKYGSASVIVPLSALYPAITAILAYLFLKEKLMTHQWLGIALAVLSIILLSIEEL